MKRIMVSLSLLLSAGTVWSQNLRGTVTVQNRDEFVKGAFVEDIQTRKSTRSDDEGNFSMYLYGVEYEDDISLGVKLSAKYNNYIVVNADEYGFVKATLYRTKPVNIFIREHAEYTADRKRSIDNNVENNPINQEYVKTIQLLGNELEQEKRNNNLLNDSLLVLRQEQSDLIRRIVADVDRIMRKNISSLDETKPAEARLKKVYGYKLRGDLTGAMEIMGDAEQLLREAIEQNTEREELQAYIDLVMEKARTFMVLNNHKEAIRSYEECVNADPSNNYNMVELIQSFGSIGDYDKADEYLRSLELRYDKLIKENPQRYLPDYAIILRYIAYIYQSQSKNIEAARYFDRSLYVYVRMENENIRFNKLDLALLQNNLGYHYVNIDHSKADIILQHSLININACLESEKENTGIYSLIQATVLNNIGYNYLEQCRKEMQKKDHYLEQAESRFKESLDILDRSEDNPLALPIIGIVSQNLGFIYSFKGNYPVADTFFQRALDIYTSLAKDDPYIYNPSLANVKTNMGGRYYLDNNPHKAFALWAEAEETGNAVIWHNLGNNYELLGDLEKAFDLFRKAAEQGLYNAQRRLALCFYDGKGVERDLEKAVYWFRKAAEQGYAQSQYELGVLYYDRAKRSTHDYKEAFYWLIKASDLGYEDAEEKLTGYLKESDMNMMRDYETAKKMVSDEAEQEKN